MNKTRVTVGLSGGVDSAVSAYLLKKQGFDISGVYLHCFDNQPAGGPGCRGKQDRQDALKVALHLKIPFQVLDFRKEYKSAVIAYFKKEYLAGRTPNPDVICNRDIKFGLLLDWCIKNGFDYLATGHYADVAEILPEQNFAATPAPAEKRATSRERIVHEVGEWQAKAGATILRIPKDKHKDQTYFLWAVPRQKFSRVLFPLSDFRKKEVRSLAKLAKIPVADKPDSTGICFVGEIRVEDFLKRLGVKEKVGEVVMRSERRASSVERRSTLNARRATYSIIGSHRGVWFYTIGQRHGFSTDLWSSKKNVERRALNVDQRSTLNAQRSTLIEDRPPLYVISKDVRKNRLVVGFGAETYRDNFEVSNCNWLVSNFEFRISNLLHVYVRIRHLGDLIPCSITSVERRTLSVDQRTAFSAQRSTLTVRLSEPQRGVAAGQSAVFYSKQGAVLGGGVIQDRGES